jgi:DHA1 family multidrug resistance protein-like MFS transporter
MLFRAAQNDAQTSIAPIGEAGAHLHAAVVGGIIALAGAVTVAVTLLSGRLARQGSVHRWLLAGLVLTALSLPALAVARSWPVLLVASCALGAGGGLAFPSLASMVGHHDALSPKQRMSGFALALSVSLSVGPLLDSAVLGLTGDSIGLSLLVFAALPLGAIGLLALARPSAGGDDPVGLDPMAAEDPAAATAAVGPRPADDGSEDGTPPWRRRGWRLAVAAQLLYQVPFVAVISFGVVAADQLDGLRPASAELGISAFFAVSMLTRVALTLRRPIERPRRAVLVVAAVTMAGVVLLAVGGSPLLLFVALGVLGVPHGLVYPVALGLIAEETPPSQLVRANATFSAATTTVSAVTPALLGVVAAAAGLRIMFLVLLLPVGAIGALVVGWRGLRPAPLAAGVFTPGGAGIADGGSRGGRRRPSAAARATRRPRPRPSAPRR